MISLSVNIKYDKLTKLCLKILGEYVKRKIIKPSTTPSKNNEKNPKYLTICTKEILKYLDYFFVYQFVS